MIKELDVVRLKKEDEEYGVKHGCLGTVVDVQGNEFCVEFIDENGNTILKALDKYYPSEELEVV